MRYEYSDGGCRAAGYSPRGRDCVTRAICHITGKRYFDVYNDLYRIQPYQSPRKGVFTERQAFVEYVHSLGFVGPEAPQGVQLGQMPTEGVFLVRVHRHMLALKHGVVYDAFKPKLEQMVLSYYEFLG